jgi:hypothetical protein
MRNVRPIFLAISFAVFCHSSAGALELWYDFEGDSTAAIDKLIDDGAQNGTLQNNVSIQSADVLFGTQSALFDIPDPVDPVNPPFSTIEIPGSTALGDDFTLAIHVDNQEAALDFTRLITSYRGTGAVGNDRVLLDYDPTGGVIPGIRAIVNNTVVQTAAPPAGITNPGYHHYALAVDSGDVRIYFDGGEVASGNVGTGYVNTHNLYIGEDPHDGGGAANEQLIGNVDDAVVINRALSASDILALAGGVASDTLTPVADEYAVYYDFEGDAGATITDKFTADGAQDGIAHLQATVGGNPRFGGNSGQLDIAVAGTPFSRIEVGQVGNLGSAFTMSATVDFPQAGFSAEDLTRMFSTFEGSGSAAGRLILDFNPDADVSDIGIRLILPDGTTAVAGDTFSLNERHTFTATYDNGDVQVYLDGSPVASASTSGDVDLGAFPLYIGEDISGAVNENFIGTMDDVFIVGRALSTEEVLRVHQSGAASVIPEPSTAAMVVMGLLSALAWVRRRH